MNHEILAKVISIIEAQIGIAPDGEDSNLEDDLGIDEIDLVEITLAIEDEFHVDIPDRECIDWKTVSDIVKSIEQHPE